MGNKLSQIINNVSTLFEYLESIQDDCYFRGYKNLDELKPILGRNSGFKDNEYKMITDLTNLKEVRALKIKTLRGLLELSQHYGLPTRLLDWSKNPFVALYFALGKKCEYDDSLVFMAFLDRKSQQLIDVKVILDIHILLPDLDPSTVNVIDNCSLSELGYFGPEVEHHDIGEFLKLSFAWKKYEEYVSKIENFIMFKYKKDFVNKRKEAQEGIFSFHKSIDSLFPQELYENIEICFDMNQKNEASERLAQKGIDAPFLFPDDEIFKCIERKCDCIKKEYTA